GVPCGVEFVSLVSNGETISNRLFPTEGLCGVPFGVEFVSLVSNGETISNRLFPVIEYTIPVGQKLPDFYRF
ncbi:MAG: hypothetical protein J6R82_05440, partial [Clostridia bacterium]|nr:hypothetical protein [Clostridia bacterium]